MSPRILTAIDPTGLDVVGESHHTAALARIHQQAGEQIITAALIPEPTNRHDKKAIAVHLYTGKTVAHAGYLPAQLPADIRGPINVLYAAGNVAAVAAVVHSFTTREGTIGYTVTLGADAPHAGAPLPQVSGRRIAIGCGLLVAAAVVVIAVIVTLVTR